MAYRDITQPLLEGFHDRVQNFEFDLDASIEHIAHWLPAQGPIKDFIHHNTLHAVQHYSFHEGVAVGRRKNVRRTQLCAVGRLSTNVPARTDQERRD